MHNLDPRYDICIWWVKRSTTWIKRKQLDHDACYDYGYWLVQNIDKETISQVFWNRSGNMYNLKFVLPETWYKMKYFVDNPKGI